MATATIEDVRTWEGRTVIDSRGDRIGKVEDIYFDERAARPEWALVNTGMLGVRQNFVPLTRARTVGAGVVQVPFTEEQIGAAPSVEPNGELSQQQEEQLYEHYGIERSQAGSTSPVAETTRDAAGPAGYADRVRTPHELARLGGHGRAG